MLLDGQQGMIEKAHNTVIDMPVLYFTQLIGLAMGLGEKELELDKNMVSTSKLIASIGKEKLAQNKAQIKIEQAVEAEAVQ
jgi:heterodisulfide reductase subunit B